MPLIIGTSYSFKLLAGVSPERERDDAIFTIGDRFYATLTGTPCCYCVGGAPELVATFKRGGADIGTDEVAGLKF
jgi:hypothetical protein